MRNEGSEILTKLEELYVRDALQVSLVRGENYEVMVEGGSSKQNIKVWDDWRLGRRYARISAKRSIIASLRVST